MKKTVKRAVLSSLKNNVIIIILFAVIFAVSYGIFALYEIDSEPFWYAFLLGVVIIVIYLVVSCARAVQKAKMRARVLDTLPYEWDFSSSPCSCEEEDYREMICILGERIRSITLEAETEHREMSDYYTTWVHQIKTPIAVMRMMLNEDTDEHRKLLLELFRIEQYAEMALQYIRLDTATNDLVIKPLKLDELIRECIRKFAPQFVMKQIRLEYDGTDTVISTDKKWFACMLEQLLSNAVKYTTEGSVVITDNGKLSVTDTGAGIPSEDLPRIFEKGFTGRNGRAGKQSSGLGLYLCKKAADKLNLKVEAESTHGQGSTFSIVYRKNI